ncbi:MAG: insulinase family protein [Gemmatimonadaceae bacterium]|nr:insulinase family protein [Gemmatimonadaceae bacterium]
MRTALPTLLLSAALAHAQSAPARVDSSTVSYVASGVQVIHRRTASNNVVANLYLLGGARQVTRATAGIEPFLLQVSEAGTLRYPKAALRRVMARTGSGIVVEARDDWTLYGLRTTTQAFDSVWSVFADRLMAPRLDSADVEQERTRFLSAIRQRAEDPDALLERTADSVFYGDHPYGLPVEGSETSIARFTRGTLRAYLTAQMVTSRMLLVVVGNVPRAVIEARIASTLGKLPRGAYAWTLPDALPPSGSAAAIVARSLPTNYLAGYYRGPRAGSADAAALRIATAVLSGELYSEIRSRRNLTYAVNAPFRDEGLVSGGLYVTTTEPDSVLALMKESIALVQAANIPADGLRSLIQQFITEYFLDNETSTAQADFLARNQLYRGDWRAGDRFIAELRAVTGEDVRRVAQKYFRDVRWAYVGNPARVRREGLVGF